MKCKACPYFIWMKRKEEGSKTIEVRLSCEREKRQIGHDELDKNGCPIWCPLNKKNDKKQAENYQRSEKNPQGKCQNPPEMPDSIAGIPVSDLLFIAHALEGHVDILEKIKDGYKFGYSLGYEHGFKEFHSQLAKSFERINTEPIRFERAEDFDFTKVKLELAPPTYNLKDAALDMAARFYGKKLTDVPKVINVVTPSTDGDDKK